MNLRRLLPLALLSSAFALSACGNKGPLLPPPAPDDDEWPADQADEPADAQDDVDPDDVDQDDADQDDGVDPAADDEDPADASAGDDGDGDA